MKIIVGNKFYFEYGGTERYCLGLCRLLTDHGHQVAPFCVADRRNIPSDYARYFPPSPDPEASRAPSVPRLTAALRCIHSGIAARKLEALIDDFRPDVVHLHNIYHHLSTSVLEVLRTKRVPVVMTLHDYKLICPNYSLFTGGAVCTRCRGRRYYNAVSRRCLKGSLAVSALGALESYWCAFRKVYERSVDTFICPSRFMKDMLIEFGFPKEKLAQVRHAVDLAGFAPGGAAGSSILYCGRLIPHKGLDMIIDSAKRFASVRFTIVGQGPYRKHLEGRLEREGIANVELVGFKKSAEVADYIRQALFLVVPSLWYEVAGLVVYEASACNKCVVASAIGALPEIVEDGKNGLLFTAADQNSFEEKIRYLLATPQAAIALGEEAGRMIAARNDRESHYQELFAIYKGAIGRKAA